MLGTPSGYWYGYKELPNGVVDYEFFQDGERLQDGVCPLDEMIERFTALIAASARHALDKWLETA